MRVICSILLLSLSTGVFAQGGNFGSSDNWRRTQQELMLGLGATNFLGDLGGLDQTGTDYSIVDIEWPLTLPSAYIGYRYRFSRIFSTRTMFTWGMVMGDDNLTAEPFRNYRNLHFKSHVWELSQMAEFGYSFDKPGRRYNIQGAKGFKNKSFYLYVYIGIGAMYFNPKAQYNGSWVALQPLGTEGQNVDPEQKRYSRITYTVPMGGGFRGVVWRNFTLGIEVCYRKIGSDYIDDVSGDYYNNDIILSEQGDKAAYLADPSSGANPNWTIHGEQRGDPTTKDAILSAHLIIGYNLSGFSGKRTKGAFGYRKKRSRAQF